MDVDQVNVRQDVAVLGMDMDAEAASTRKTTRWSTHGIGVLAVGEGKCLTATNNAEISNGGRT